MSNFDSTIQSIQMIIGNLEENLQDCKNSLENSMAGVYPTCREYTENQIVEIEADIAEHKEAIIALQIVASGERGVI